MDLTKLNSIMKDGDTVTLTKKELFDVIESHAKHILPAKDPKSAKWMYKDRSFPARDIVWHIEYGTRN